MVQIQLTYISLIDWISDTYSQTLLYRAVSSGLLDGLCHMIFTAPSVHCGEFADFRRQQHACTLPYP